MSIQHSITTSQETSYPKSDKAKSDTINAIKDSDMVVFTDADADGIASAGLVESVFGGSMDVCMIPAGHHRSIMWESTAFDLISEYAQADSTVWVLDTCFNEQDQWIINKLRTMCKDHRVHIFDHHEWTDSSRIDSVSEYAEYVEIDSESDSESWIINGNEIHDRCTAQMVYDYMESIGNVDFDPYVKDRIKAIAAGDLWLRKDNSDEFIHPDTSIVMDSIEYITNKPYHERQDEDWYGYKMWVSQLFADETLENTVVKNMAEQYLEQINAQIEYVLENEDQFITEYHSEDIDLVAVYGDIAPNYLAEKFRLDGYDGVASLRPNVKVSLRGTDTFSVCQTVAEQLGGGGHKKAAGASLYSLFPESESEYSVEMYRDEHGARIREKVLELMKNAYRQDGQTE